MRTLFLVIIFAVISGRSLYAVGGPDTYGYTWMTSQDVGGPTAQFLDISSYGTLVTGLADDNSAAGTVNIGFPFHYYWNDYTQMKIGSNGWVSFNVINNIASCFPTIPAAGGPGDNYLAPLMADLNFTGVGNVGQVYTYTNNIDTFIIMYKNVPFWTVSVPGWTGSNSFEVILCKADSSITFQYQNLGGFTANAACVDLTVGIENSTGAIGLQVHSDVMPPSNYAIKFFYPDVVLISVADVAPRWNNNPLNRGIFIPTGNFTMTSNVKNVGNVNVSTPINITGNIKNLAGVTQFTSNYMLGSLNIAQDTTFDFPTIPTINTAGEYYFETSLTNTSDINPGNNLINSEIEVINICTNNFKLGYTSTVPATSSVNWDDGANDDGVAVRIIPPVYPVIITQMETFISANTGDGLLARIYADNGPNGSPGTLLYDGSIPSASIVSNNWNVHSITPVTIDSGGFYLSYFQTGNSIFIGALNSGPLSRRNYEILDGLWSIYRFNATQDLMIRCQVDNPYFAGPPQPGAINGPAVVCEGTSSVAYDVAPVPGATSYAWTLPGGWTGSSTADTINGTPGTNGTISVVANNSCGTSTAQTLNVSISDPVLNLTPVSANCNDSCDGSINAIASGGLPIYAYTPFPLTDLCAGNYTVTVTDAAGCTTTSTTTIAEPTVINASASAVDPDFCVGNCTDLNINANGGTPGYSYLWMPGSITTANPNVCPSSNTTYTCTVTDSNNCIQSTTVDVTVFDLPMVDFTYPGNDTICTSYGIQSLSGGSPAGGIYSGTGVSGSNFDPVVSGTGAHDIVYTYTDINGCSDMDTSSIVVIGCAGIGSNEENLILVYPNPFTGSIQINGIENPVEVSLYNSLGEAVGSWMVSENNFIIHTEELKTGIYFLRIGDHTEKMIKQ